MSNLVFSKETEDYRLGVKAVLTGHLEDQIGYKEGSIVTIVELQENYYAVVSDGTNRWTSGFESMKVIMGDQPHLFDVRTVETDNGNRD